MLRHFLESLQGNSLFGILSTLIFLAYFAWMIVYALRLPKEEEKEFSQIPLDDSSDSHFMETEKQG